MNKTIPTILIIGLMTVLILFGGGIWSRFTTDLPALERISEKIREVETKIFAPPPLIKEGGSGGSVLTADGSFDLTNKVRQDNGFDMLRRSGKLDEAALIKARDILEQGYFEHVSPDGRGPEHLAETVAYEFITVGENLALGDFEDDRDLIVSWMQSEGHRENILNPNFSELGIAVIRGEYKGKETWVAVQEFGRPLSDCAQPDPALKKKIADNEKKAEVMADTLERKKKDIEDSSLFGANYRQEVELYNMQVIEYNILIAGLKAEISEYNRLVNAFNECVKTQ
jgi:hypothetical protein